MTKPIARSYQEKLSLLNELIHLGDVDGRMAMEEFELIRAIAERLGISDEDLEKVVRTEVPFTPPKSEMERILWLQAFSLVTIADERVDEREVKFIQRIGLRLGFNPQPINELLRRLMAHPGKPLSPGDLIRLFQVSHN